MYRNNSTIILGFISVLIIFFCVQNNMCQKIFKIIMLNKELNSLLVTLIAGLFGFIVAIIPFAIHLLNQNDDFMQKLKRENNFNVLIKPLFDRLLSFLKNMFVLFVFLLIFSVVREIFIDSLDNKILFKEHLNISEYTLTFVFGIYFVLICNFLIGLYRLIRDLKSLVQIFLKTHIKES